MNDEPSFPTHSAGWRRLLSYFGLFLILPLAAGCGKSKPPATETSPSSTSGDSVMPAEKRDLFAAVASGEIKVRLARKDYAGSVHGATFIIGGGHGSTQYSLELENLSPKRLQPTTSAYAFATLENMAGYKNPYPEDDPPPEFFYFLAFPAKGLEPLNPGKGASVPPDKVWYLGNSKRPEVSTSTSTTKGHGEESFILKPAPDDSPFARLARLLGKNPAIPDKNAGTLLHLLAHTTPDDVLQKSIPSRPYAETFAMEKILREGNFPEADHPSFAEARKKHEALLSQLQSAVDSNGNPQLENPFCEGDVEIARLAARCLKPREQPDGVPPLPSQLALLKVSDPGVLDPLFAFATQDGDEFSRMEAALSGVRLGDPRSIPLLVQYLDHPEMNDSDVQRIILSCNTALTDIWKTQGKYENGGKMNWKDACKKFGGLDAPELKKCRSEDLSALKTFLDSRKNLRPDALNKLCKTAAEVPTGPNGDILRNRAIESLARTPNYNAQPQVRELFLHLIRNDPDKGARYNAIVETNYMPPFPGVEEALIEILKGYQGVTFTGSDKENADKNLLGGVIQSLSNKKSKAAIPTLLSFLDRTDHYAQATHEALQQITNLHPVGKSRADWDTELKKAGLP